MNTKLKYSIALLWDPNFEYFTFSIPDREVLLSPVLFVIYSQHT